MRATERATAGDRPRTPRLPPASATHDDIARRAYDMFLARGGEHGHDLDDWLTAERELSGGLDAASR